MRTNLEAALGALLEGNTAKAEALFHDYILNRARSIHESLRIAEEDESFEDDGMGEESFSEDDLGDSDMDTEMSDAEGNLDGAEADLDAAEGDLADVDGDVDADLDGDMGGVESTEDKLDDLDAKLDDLMARFDEFMNDESETDFDSLSDGSEDEVTDESEEDFGDDVEGDVAGDESDEVEADDEDWKPVEESRKRVAEKADKKADKKSDKKDSKKKDCDEDEFDKLAEGIIDELEKLSVSTSDGQELGGKSFEQNKKSNLTMKKAEASDAAPIKRKESNHASFERETAPGVKPMKARKNNVKGNAVDQFKDVPKEGNKSALLNKDFAKGAAKKD